jgi:Zn-dependent M16 (insulinase) family peptidase
MSRTRTRLVRVSLKGEKLASELPTQARCSSLAGISFGTSGRDPVILAFTLDFVVAKRLLNLGSDFLSTLDRLCRGRFDMKRMKARLEEWRLDVLQTLESSPESCVISAVSDDALYGREDDATFSEQWNDMIVIDELLLWKENDWRNLLATWFIDRHCVTLTGIPSAELAAEQAEATKERVAATCQHLGRGGLLSLEQRLAAAKRVTTQPVPPALLSSFKPPDVACIHLPRAETARSRGTGGGPLSTFKSLQSTINKDPANLPYFLQFNHYASSFVSVCAYLGGTITDHWPLFIDSFFSMPVQRQNGKVLSYQEAYRQLDDLAVGFSANGCSEGECPPCHLVTSPAHVERLQGCS